MRMEQQRLSPNTMKYCRKIQARILMLGKKPPTLAAIIDSLVKKAPKEDLIVNEFIRF